MKLSRFFIAQLAGMAAVSLTAACTRTVVVVAVPHSAPPAYEQACSTLPASVPSFTPAGRANPKMVAETPAIARQAHVYGCAGIMFQLAANGAPINAKLLTEQPTGYGFGAAALEALQGNRFHPKRIDQSWHYLVFGISPLIE